MDKYRFERQRVSAKALPGVVVTKWNEAVLEEGFVPFPKRLLRCMNQIFKGKDAIERLMVVLAIADYRRPNLTRGPSREFLAFVSDLSLERLNAMLDGLSKDGLISVTDVGTDELEVGLEGLLARVQALTPVVADELPF